MLDAAAGFVVRRIRSRHLNAVSRAEDLASLLHAYAALGHNSVAVPELLAAVGEQVCPRCLWEVTGRVACFFTCLAERSWPTCWVRRTSSSQLLHSL